MTDVRTINTHVTTTDAANMDATAGDSTAGAVEPTFSEQMWAQTAGVRASIDDLQFVRELADGTLDRGTFDHYMAQDAHYLREYARVLAQLAELAPTAEGLVFWGKAAVESIEVEMSLHAGHVDVRSGMCLPEPSPTCVLYTSFLTSATTRGGYACGTAAVLPCFAVYQDVGTRIAARVRRSLGGADLSTHPYGDWIAAYEDEAFAKSTRQAAQFADVAHDAADEATREQMARAYTTATRCEWMFWESAHRREAWPV